MSLLSRIESGVDVTVDADGSVYQARGRKRHGLEVTDCGCVWQASKGKDHGLLVLSDGRVGHRHEEDAAWQEHRLEVTPWGEVRQWCKGKLIGVVQCPCSRASSPGWT